MKSIKTALLMGLVFLFNGIASANSYTCYNMVNGEATGGSVQITADSKEEAKNKAAKKYKEIGYTSDSADCRLN